MSEEIKTEVPQETPAEPIDPASTPDPVIPEPEIQPEQEPPRQQPQAQASGRASSAVQALQDISLVYQQVRCVRALVRQLEEFLEVIEECVPSFGVIVESAHPSSDFGASLLERYGLLSYRLMEHIGAILSDMDVVDEDDDRWDKTFEDAQARWNPVIEQQEKERREFEERARKVFAKRRGEA